MKENIRVVFVYTALNRKAEKCLNVQNFEYESTFVPSLTTQNIHTVCIYMCVCVCFDVTNVDSYTVYIIL